MTYKIFKLTHNENKKTYYGKSKLNDNILLNLMKNYENNPKLSYYEILKDKDFTI